MTAEHLLLTGSLSCCAAFYVLAAVAYVVRRPITPPVLAPTSDLGTENPAVANLLANGGAVTAEAVPATLLDLAARKIVAIDETEPHVYAVGINQARSGGLTPYESRVMTLLRSKASGGTVPAAALTIGEPGQARSWFRSFSAEVVREARGAGLCVPRWPPRLLTALGLLVFAAFIGVGLSTNEDSDSQDLFWGITLGVTLATVAASAYLFRDTMQLVTRAGLGPQSRWLALRRYLREDELFATLPPTAVVVRERYLAYGAALGVAAAAVRAIPMGAENDRRAWSSYGGKWRQVTVSYPTMWPPAWGASPGETIWRGVRLTGAAAAVLYVFSLLLPRLSLAHSADQATRDLSAGGVLVAAVALVVLSAGMWLLLAGVVSMFGVRQVTGDAVRLRSRGDPQTCYLAVDDGTQDHIRAWKVSSTIYSSVTEYSTVTVTVSPLLGYVRTVRRATAPQASAPAPAST